VVDRDEGRINAWKGKHLPIHEPGLVEVVRLARDGCKEGLRRDSAQGQGHGLVASLDGAVASDAHKVDQPARLPNLFFSTACTQTIAEADMILISVNTPTKRRGVGAGRATDMTAIEGAVRDVATYARSGTILVEKSTVPCKTGQLIKDIVGTTPSHATNNLADLFV
jgi:UDPglucose 6-dehydrogenase